MPFKSKNQAKYMFTNMPTMAKEWAAHTKSMKALPDKVHHSGNGTRARLNTAAEKNFFSSKVSK